MLRPILSFGLVAGLLVGIPLSAIVASGLSPEGAWGMVIGYAIMLVAFSTVFVAIKRRRDGELGGVIRFWPAFGMGIGISVVAGVIYVAAWEATCALNHLDFGAAYAQAMIAKEKAAGVSGPKLAADIAEMRRFAVQYRDPLFRLPMTFIEIFPVGVLVSLVSAALLRSPRFLPAPRAG